MMSWLRDYWYIPLIIIGLVLLWIVTGTRKGNPVANVQKELDAIEAGRLAREEKATLGSHTATVRVKKKYQNKLEKLDEKDKRKAETLETDPVALAKFLERTTR
jgi:hypothetical protein